MHSCDVYINALPSHDSRLVVSFMSNRRLAASPALVARWSVVGRWYVRRLFLARLLDSLRAGVERSLALADGLR